MMARADATWATEETVASEAEFLHLLGGEGDAEGEVDIEGLVDLARYGLPTAVRAQVWTLLLGVSKPNKCTRAASRALAAMAD